MNSKRKGVWLLLSAGSACLIVGCATGPFGVPRAAGQTKDPSLAASIAARSGAAPESATAPEAARLAAIEEFLERTSDYQWSEPTTAVVDAPSDHTTLPDRTPRRPRSTHLDSRGPSANALPSANGGEYASKDEPSATPDRAAANARMSVSPPEPPTARPALPTLLSISVRPQLTERPGLPPASQPDPARITNVALDVREKDRSFSFDDWMADLSVEAEHGRNVAAEWKLRLIELATGRDVRVDELGSALTSETRSLLGSLLKAVQAVREVVADPLASGDVALERVDALRQALADRADPVVSTVALCERVVTFGVYDEMPPDDLLAGRDIQTIVYSEIQNLQGDATPEGRFETRLATRLELFNASGESVWLKEEPEIVDVCRHRRSDFFIAQRVTFPPTLPAGSYTLKVAVEDRLADRVAERAVPLTIQSPISVARGR